MLPPEERPTRRAAAVFCGGGPVWAVGAQMQYVLSVPHRRGYRQGCHDYGYAVMVVYILYARLHFHSNQWIQTGSGLVEENELPRGAERPGQQRPPLLPAGKLPVAALLRAVMLHQFHHGLGPLPVGNSIEGTHAEAVKAAGQHHLIYACGKVTLYVCLLRKVAYLVYLETRAHGNAALAGLYEA